MNDALSRVTKASRRARRHETGEERIPSIWRATVDVVRGDQVYVRVPRLTGDSHLGPLPWAGARPDEGDRVVLAAVAGRRDDLIIINPSTDALASRLTSVEERMDEAAGEWAELSDRVESHEQALWLAEEYLEDIWDRLDRLDSERIIPALSISPGRTPVAHPVEVAPGQRWVWVADASFHGVTGADEWQATFTWALNGEIGGVGWRSGGWNGIASPTHIPAGETHALVTSAITIPETYDFGTGPVPLTTIQPLVYGRSGGQVILRNLVIHLLSEGGPV